MPFYPYTTNRTITMKDSILEDIRSIAKRNGISRVILFGSRARGDNRERSDIDLACSGGNIASFALDIEEEVRTLLMFDVVNLDIPVDPALLESIESEGILIYEEV